MNILLVLIDKSIFMALLIIALGLLVWGSVRAMIDRYNKRK